MTRIIAGTAGGRRLSTPRGTTTRPTSDRVREGLFSALEAEAGSLRGLRFLDLFAGSGAVGLEALSRGADEAVFVEHSGRAAASIRRNSAELGLHPAGVVVARVATHLATATPSRFHIVFADPPYSLPEPDLHQVGELLVGRGWLSADAVVVFERSSRDPAPVWPPGLLGWQRRRYGDTSLWYGRRSVESASPVARC